MSTQSFSSENIRNVALTGHTHAGKTALADAICFNYGANTRLGKTQDRTSLFDVEPEELHRGASIKSHFGWIDHKGIKLNFIDTPGDQNFYLDGLTSARGADTVVSVICALEGVQLQTKRSWNLAQDHNLARFILINKLDRVEKPWHEILDGITHQLNTEPVVIQLPMGTGDNFTGIIDLLHFEALKWAKDGSGKFEKVAIPDDLRAEADTARTKMIEAIISTDDTLLEEYLESGAIDSQVLLTTFIKGVKSRNLVPLLCSSAAHNIGVQALIDILLLAAPAPLDRGAIQLIEGDDVQAYTPKSSDPFLAQVIHTHMDEHMGQISIIRIYSGEITKESKVINAKSKEDIRFGNPFFLRGQQRTPVESLVCGDIFAVVKLKNTKTNHTLCDAKTIRRLTKLSYPRPMISYVLIPESKQDGDKLKEAIDSLITEDPTLAVATDAISHNLVLQGMGHGHLDNAIEKLSRKYHVKVTHELPPIAYRETLSKPIKNVEGKHKKQSGGAGQYGVAYLDFEPIAGSMDIEFVNKITGGAIPKQYIPSVEKGIRERASMGFETGIPVVGFKATVIDGKYHPVDSKDIAFQMAGFKAMKEAIIKGGLRLLEPYHKIEITLPTEYSGDVMNDITGRRGNVEGMDTQDGMTIIRANCPEAEIQRYIADLRSITQGKGTFVSEFDSYKSVPDHLVVKIRENSPYKRVEEE